VLWRSDCDANATLFGSLAPIPAAQIIYFFTRFPQKNTYFAPQVFALSENKRSIPRSGKAQKSKKPASAGFFVIG
jgi:hypothetical protein